MEKKANYCSSRTESDSRSFFLSLSRHQSESEEVRQVLWLSVVLYKSPESELTCCLLLSTDAIYFLLEDSASALGHPSGGVKQRLDLVSRGVLARKCVSEGHG